MRRCTASRRIRRNVATRRHAHSDERDSPRRRLDVDEAGRRFGHISTLDYRQTERGKGSALPLRRVLSCVCSRHPVVGSFRVVPAEARPPCNLSPRAQACLAFLCYLNRQLQARRPRRPVLGREPAGQGASEPALDFVAAAAGFRAGRRAPGTQSLRPARARSRSTAKARYDLDVTAFERGIEAAIERADQVLSDTAARACASGARPLRRRSARGHGRRLDPARARAVALRLHQCARLPDAQLAAARTV